MPMTMARTSLLVTAMLVGHFAVAEGERISFVACPVVRDTATVPCFLADNAGTTYYLGIQQDIGADWFPPQLNHKVLVEGYLSGDTVCGGLEIKPIATSVLPTVDPACNTILPAEPGIVAPHAERGAGPNGEVPGSAPRRAPPPPPEPPFAVKEFSLSFTFDDDGLIAREFGVLARAIEYAKVSKASAIDIVISRGSAKLSSGEVINEDPSAVMRRERLIRRWLAVAELPTATRVSIKPMGEPLPADGRTDENNRYIKLTITPEKR
ncbi:MAG: hypothetical protein H6978_10670 [Gammaproteobacteria bacterium]|nr:hypothetical protein [Gammaproteobacteria bacterium]